MPNGVDFNLETGACCAVKFSKQVTGSGTLNINSTGAKTYTHPKSWSWVEGLSGGSRQAYSRTGHFIAVYSGSDYIIAGNAEITGSYGDSD